MTFRIVRLSGAWLAMLIAAGCAPAARTASPEGHALAVLEKKCAVVADCWCACRVDFEGGRLVSRSHAVIAFGDYGKTFVRLESSAGDCFLLQTHRLSAHDRIGDTIDAHLLAINTQGGSFFDWLAQRPGVGAEAVYLRNFEEPPTVRVQVPLCRSKASSFDGNFFIDGTFSSGPGADHEGTYTLTLRWVPEDVSARLLAPRGN